MIQTTQRNFKSETLVVDWISFKFQELEPDRQTQVTTYLFKLGFNSYQQSGKLAKPIKESILVSSANPFEVLLVGDNSYWKGTLLHFSGSNATAFYNLASQQLIDWSIFSSSVLGRLDLYYSRTSKRTDRISVQDFLQNCQTKLKQTGTNVSFEKNSKGIILKIGNRRSNNYSRIYQTTHSLKFEYEIKGKFLRDYHSLLITNNFEEFEDKLANQFFSYFGKLLPLTSPQVDWLVLQLRPIRKHQIPMGEKSALNSHYLQIADSVDHQKFVNFLQFLSYARSLDFTIDYLGDTSYRAVVFQIHDFLKFQNRSTRSYHLQKMRNFFDELQTNFLITSFSDRHFKSLVTIPKVTFEKSNQKFWIAKVWIVEDLFYYDYPFMLPNLFMAKTNKHNFEVQFKIIQTFSSIEIEKIFRIEQFFQDYPSVLSNQHKIKMKQHFIELVQILQQYNLIETDYKIISNGKFYSTDQLTPRNISQGFVIYEKLYL